MGYNKYCIEEFRRIFNLVFEGSNINNEEKNRRYSQKKAIKDATLGAIRRFPDIEPALIWKSIYASHVHLKSEISDQNIIKSVISADNSWKKSSGHAFEEMIKELGNQRLNELDIEILLQKDLRLLFDRNEINNEAPDRDWLKQQIGSSIFDLYLIINRNEEKFVFGCIQSKTSIRDRVTRDREPSIGAMNKFFYSIAIVLDGDFLRLPKFINMVNGNSSEFEVNGWHGMYVLSNGQSQNDRIYNINIEMNLLVDHIAIAADHWITQRQWFNNEWRPDN